MKKVSGGLLFLVLPDFQGSKVLETEDSHTNFEEWLLY